MSKNVDEQPASSLGPDNELPEAKRLNRARRRTREMVIALAALCAGFILLPIAIYVVGTLLLGPYTGGQSLGAFFGDFYTHLGHGAPRTWFIALSPYLAFWIVRLCFRRNLFAPTEREPSVPGTRKEAEKSGTATRRDPFIST